MGGERREGLCDVAWMHPLLRYRGSAGAAVALHSRKHEKRAQGTFKVGVSRPPDEISAISNIYENFQTICIPYLASDLRVLEVGTEK